MTTKIKTRAELKEALKSAADNGKTIGFTNGCFDILHAGHVKYLRAAKSGCDVLVVGVNSNDSVRGLKGESRPINDESARMEVLAELECVDFLTLFHEDTPEELIRYLRPRILFKGGDWTEGSVVGARHVKANGGSVRIIPYVEGFSTTAIIEKMRGKWGRGSPALKRRVKK
ncbi:MAG: D-glycero-beta-D-manno-heptose 1-phosphate adenylyltransferase [Candidatus Omnitrophica bacterium]|nr:D-glycero-beta-D-manno-heptose 1-phosphate adenylyltransferase [Candidatus Omnitrophota bacterium]MBU1128768.1 D-glycero-beta-D-manno-heptose 1-phosphate adenylyltransferase [Candidatus Omnitrophota bacterium]MBU1656545.1 D-glycero-beta-D-manno-heptose 1-phosphate adenylyltransferase [Candidatus Omnitrophota bacterium]MBU1785231.1 D-glycero-beta-D-manno-heptose 1-phosphate adenylyltransferase [Candidatus Omnitrophota bacterium]MBU1851239.1 D-glycero-beta-D-manno-heptose 1-phosphate adenylylt